MFAHQVAKLLGVGQSSCPLGVHIDARRQRNSLVVGAGVSPGASPGDLELFGAGDRVLDGAAHYQTLYTSKRNPICVLEHCEFCVRIERLRNDEIRKSFESQSKMDPAELGGKVMIWLQTAARPE